MIIQGQPVDSEIARVQKSIASNLQNKALFQSDNKDTAEQGTELHPPVPMQDCLFIFENSSHVMKSCRILADDIIYNDITLTINSLDEPSEKEINQVKKINDYLNDNIDELHNMCIDYNYAGWGAVEYIWNNTRFTLKQIPIHSCAVARVSAKGQEVYLLKQKINSKTNWFKIMGEKYPDDFMFYDNQKLNYASLIGGDNIYQFFSIPKWMPDYNEIMTEIAISANDYKTIANGNISSGILNINLEPQLPAPIQYDDNGNPIPVTSREEVISKELQSASSGTAVIFTESNRPINLDYVSLANSNQSYLSELGEKCQNAVLNDYNIPKIRLMINTDKESLNSDKSKSIWEIYLKNLQTEQKPWKQFIRELIYELYSFDVDVKMTTPIFSDRKEIEVKLITDAWMNGGLTLKQYITGLSEYIDVIDLAEYDFTVNEQVWSYRRIPELLDTMAEDDRKLIEQIEAQLEGL